MTDMEGLEAKELWAKGWPWPFFHREHGRHLGLFLILSCLQSYPKDLMAAGILKVPALVSEWLH